jgi:hypothetical protein
VPNITTMMMATITAVGLPIEGRVKFNAGVSLTAQPGIVELATAILTFNSLSLVPGCRRHARLPDLIPGLQEDVLWMHRR